MERKLWRRFHEVLKGRGREGEEGWMWGVHWSVHGKMREEGGERVGAGCSSLEYKKMRNVNIAYLKLRLFDLTESIV